MPTEGNLGLPWWTRDRSVAPDYLRRAMEMRTSEELYPAVFAVRGTPNGHEDTNKIRGVHATDHAETILGGSMMTPILNGLRKVRGFAGWSTLDDIDGAISRLMESAQGRVMHSLDYRHFDVSVPIQLNDIGFDILEHWLSDGCVSRLNIIRDAFSLNALVVPYDLLDGRNGGVPSGSVFTNLVDSLINALTLHYIAERAGTEVLDFEVLGDDAVVVFSDDVSVDDISRFASELNLELNPDKQYTSTTSVHFLQRLYDLAWKPDHLHRGVRSPYRFASGYLGMEIWKQNWNLWRYTAREVCQVEHCRWDPRAEHLFRFIIDGDSTLQQGHAISEIFRMAGGSEQVRSDLDRASFRYGVVDPEGVENFAFTRFYNGLN
jgi:hypothetical protein